MLQPFIFLPTVLILFPGLLYKALYKAPSKFPESMYFMFAHIWCFRSNEKATPAAIVGTHAETDFLQHLVHKEGGLGHQMDQFEQHQSDTDGQL